MAATLPEEALQYHREPRPGKIGISITKPCSTQRDLSLAYTPGVAEPVRRIAADADAAYHYTAKGNLVAVISNGTAVLGLGDVGPTAAKPVMEGKGVLFKRFADIDVFDIEIDATDPEEVVRIVKALEPTFGGINLEDIRAPDCFEIERRLRESLQIPVFHDDQHGTAIIAGAALLNALEVSGRTIAELKTVISGAGAAAIACAEFLIALGLPPENLTLVDSKGVIYHGREEGMNPFKAAFARDTAARTLADAVRGADFFLGLSVAGALEPDMLASMAERPIVFALANPDPEIDYELARRRVRPDAIVATGRSDYPNQVNNVLGFPFIFRGALDVRARTINEEMKIAAARALAELARTDVPDSVLKAYNLDRLAFGPEYLIPKPLDPRVLLAVAPAVAQAAMATGVARQTIDLDAYRANLERRFGKAREIKRMLIERARSRPQRVVFAEGEEPRIIRAAAIVQEEGIGHPVLIGRPERVAEQCAQMGLPRLDVVWPDQDPRLGTYIDVLWRLRQRKGVTRREAERLMRRPYYFGAMMVRRGDGDALVGGLTSHYPDVLRPALEVIQTAPGVRRVAGMYVMIVRDQTFFTDATVNIAPSAEELADIAILAADTVSALGFEPHIAMLSFSNFGSTRHPLAEKVRQAVEIVAARRPDLEIDGEMQADTAVVPEIRETEYPFSRLRGQANVLVFPDLEAANIAYKLLQRLGGAEAIGPVLMGMGRSVHVLQRGDRVEEIVNVAAMAVVDAQRRG